MNRRGTALVGVMVLLLVLMALGGTLLTRSRGTRRKLQNSTEVVQRDLALDAAFVHAFHLLKEVRVHDDQPLEPAPVPPTKGSLGDLEYSFTTLGDPRKGVVRIDARVEDEKVTLEGYVIAAVTSEPVDRGRVEQRWSLRYYGPEPRLKGPDDP